MVSEDEVQRFVKAGDDVFVIGYLEISGAEDAIDRFKSLLDVL